MYKKASSGWLKHFDFIILDLLCLQFAFVIAYMLRHGMVNPYTKELYLNTAVYLVFADIVVTFFNETFSGVLKRGLYKEFAATFKHSFMVALLAVFYLFATQKGEDYSRLVLGLMGVLYVIISYVARLGWKYILKHKILAENKKSLLIITTEAEAENVIKEITSEASVECEITGMILLDSDNAERGTDDIGDRVDDAARGAVGNFERRVSGVPVVANEKNAASYICKNWVDEVLIHVSPEISYSQQLIDDIAETGVIIHISLTELTNSVGKRQFVETVGNYTVLTTSINYMTPKEAFFKRTLDVVGGLVGCILTGVIFIFIAPIIYIASPGPIFFSQTRVGKNGKQFKLYKFRSMYMDAEERKKELMKQNRVADGFMFKMDFDPRIIGNKVSEDGTKKTGIGDFIRRTSLDEFPQFYNVLKGDMSLVGTRPPTLDECEKYELHHRARLATKPGITGMWQVSGRSQITDFEEVVKLDTKYINEWSMGLDLRILCKTVLAVLKRDGSM